MSAYGSLRKNRTINEDRNYAGTNQSRRSQVEDGGRYDSMAIFDHASGDSSDLSLVRLIKSRSLTALIWHSESARELSSLVRRDLLDRSIVLRMKKPPEKPRFSKIWTLKGLRKRWEKD